MAFIIGFVFGVLVGYRLYDDIIDLGKAVKNWQKKGK